MSAAEIMKQVIVRVEVRTRSDLLDPQADTILTELKALSPFLRELAVGRTFDLVFEGLDVEQARLSAERLAREVLCHPVLEESHIAEVTRKEASS